MLARSLSYATIKTYLAGIEFYSIRSGFCRVIPFMQRLFYVLRGIRRYKAAQSNRPPKKPITVVLLVSLFRFTSLSYSPHDAAMLHVAMSFAFFGMLRVSEYTVARSFQFSPNSTLLCRDVSLVGDCIHIYIKSSKTDPFRSGVTIRVGRSRGRCCPVRAFVQYRSLSVGIGRAHYVPSPMVHSSLVRA